MSKAEAYKIVFEDLLANGGSLYRGIYDATYGNSSFLLGMSAVMDDIASHISVETQDQYKSIFYKNYLNSRMEAMKDRTQEED